LSRFCRTATSAARIFLIVAGLACLHSRASAQDQTVFMATPEQLKDGFAVEVEGLPGFVRYEGAAESGTTLEINAAGLDKPVHVTVVSAESAPEKPVILPVEIEDKSLARGVTLNLVTSTGESVHLVIPPKRVFLSIPFTIPVPEQVNPDFAKTGRHLIVQIVPKITKKAQVNVDNTAADGIVATIKYEGIANFKLKDLLNRTNRRDMDGTFFIGKQEDYRWHIIAENLFEKFDKRNIGVAKNQRLGGEFTSQWRLDQLNNIHRTKPGLNLKYSEDKSSLLIGNIDRRVKDNVHSEIGYGTDRLRLVTRFEGIEVYNPPSWLGAAIRADRFGYQLTCAGGGDRKSYFGRFGNLKVQDFEDEGEIDDYFNFEFNYSQLLGSQSRRWNPDAATVSGDTSLTFWGRGSASWLRGEINLDASYKTDYLMYFRYNNDFMRITGAPSRPRWESAFISLMRNRNYFKRRDKLARYGLESIHIDFDYSREGKGVPFSRKTRAGVSKVMTIWKYDVPLELYFESVKFNVYRPGVGISIRRYL
jgi:hypothetical protein